MYVCSCQSLQQSITVAVNHCNSVSGICNTGDGGGSEGGATERRGKLGGTTYAYSCTCICYSQSRQLCYWNIYRRWLGGWGKRDAQEIKRNPVPKAGQG